MGRLSPEKGIDLLLEALAILKVLGLNFTLRIGGDGALKSELMRQAESLNLSVEWVGWVRDKTAFLYGLDYYVMPSRTETFPITLLEAMAHGLPVIATRCGGAEAIIEHNVTGLLCAIDPQALAEMVALALRSPQLSHSLASNAATFAAQHFSFEVVSAQLSALVSQFSRTTSST
jgi:glycosyltransferase involved in cell wall biosynthesis